MAFFPIIRFILLGSAATLIATAAEAQSESVIYSFPYYAGAYSRVYEDSAGRLYGTEYYGAKKQGSVFDLHESKGVWSEHELFKFDGSDGEYPYAGLSVDGSGNLIGTTYEGGTRNQGTVFSLTPTGANALSQTVLYNFSGGIDGGLPYGGALVSKTGTIYATTTSDGPNRCGTVIDLNQSGGNWTETTLYGFQGGSDGCTPETGLHPGNKEGEYFGTTNYGGSENAGTLYMLEELRGVWSERVLHTFLDSSDGGYPGDIYPDTKGNVYGVAATGGTYNAGVVYEWPDKGRKLSILYNLRGGNDGNDPVGVYYDRTTGIIYGTTQYGGNYNKGTAFKMVQSGGRWTETVLHSFGASGDGAYPQARVNEDPTTGTLYGTTLLGGAENDGTVWEVTP